MSTRHPNPGYRHTQRTQNRTHLPPDTRSEEEKAKDGTPTNHAHRGRYVGGPGKRLFP